MVAALSILIAFALFAYRIFVRKIIKEKNQKHEADILYQKNLLKQNIETQESERQRIAVLLHDDIGNKLNVLSVWLNNPDTWNSERSKEIVIDQLPELIETTRNISHSLYPVNLERFGLLSALDDLITNVGPSMQIELVVLHEYTIKDLSLEVKVYRIIQEFLSNVLKHAQAEKMLIHIRDSVAFFYILLTDNGKGFLLNQSKTGMGLRNIESRLRSVNAEFKWKSKLGWGSRLIIKIPK